jgi:tRNA (adenine57-N1/adenine58-N1)-methyltransferase catalytic subunit
VPVKARTQRGPFAAGDQVQLTDPKGRMHQIVLSPGGTFHTHRGSLSHDELIGQPEGSVVTASSGTAYVGLRPLLADYTLAMKRGATIVYPKDAAQILAYADVFPGARVLEAGAGSGALSCWLLRAVGPDGELVSFEARGDFAEIARENVRKYFGEVPPWWRLVSGELSARVALDPALQTGAAYSRLHRDSEAADGADGVDGVGGTDGAAEAGQPAPAAGTFDRVVLDMLAPWENVDGAARALIPGGLICCYVATTTQLSRVVEELRAHGGFFEPAAWETLNRGWHVEGLAVRPDHRMIAHTGFLVTARRLADGVTAPPRRRRPAKGAHPEASAGLAGTFAGQEATPGAALAEPESAPAGAPLAPETAAPPSETGPAAAVTGTGAPLPGDAEPPIR